MAKSLREVIQQAVDRQDAALAGKVADTCRFRLGMTYDQTYEFVNTIAPITKPKWERLLYDCEWKEGY